MLVCYDYTGMSYSGMFCDFNGGNRTNGCDGSPAVLFISYLSLLLIFNPNQ